MSCRRRLQHATYPNRRTNSGRPIGRRSREIHIRLVIVSSGTSCISRRSTTFGSQSRRDSRCSWRVLPRHAAWHKNRSGRVYFLKPLSRRTDLQCDERRMALDNLTCSPQRGERPLFAHSSRCRWRVERPESAQSGPVNSQRGDWVLTLARCCHVNVNWLREVNMTRFEFIRLSQLATSGTLRLGGRGACGEM
jgi:hypothetical protein